MRFASTTPAPLGCEEGVCWLGAATSGRLEVGAPCMVVRLLLPAPAAVGIPAPDAVWLLLGLPADAGCCWELLVVAECPVWPCRPI